MTETLSPEWQWRWYFSTPAQDRYVIARVWSNEAVGTVIVGENALQLAIGETEEVISNFVKQRLPSPAP